MKEGDNLKVNIKKKGGTSPRTLKAIADTLNVDPRELLSEQEKEQRLGKETA